MRLVCVGKCISLFKDKEKIQGYLNAGLLGEWNARRIKDTRDTVMPVLEPYFAGSKIKIEPVVAEDMFEFAGRDGNAAKGKYAELLRNNPVMPEVLRSEYKGIMDLLEGRYKGRL